MVRNYGAVHLALKVLSKRLTGDRKRLTEAHGCIYFGGMTFSQIERNIYRRAPYLYKSPKEAVDALDVDMRTSRSTGPRVNPSQVIIRFLRGSVVSTLILL